MLRSRCLAFKQAKPAHVTVSLLCVAFTLLVSKQTSKQATSKQATRKQANLTHVTVSLLCSQASKAGTCYGRVAFLCIDLLCCALLCFLRCFVFYFALLCVLLLLCFASLCLASKQQASKQSWHMLRSRCLPFKQAKLAHVTVSLLCVAFALLVSKQPSKQATRKLATSKPGTCYGLDALRSSKQSWHMLRCRCFALPLLC